MKSFIKQYGIVVGIAFFFILFIVIMYVLSGLARAYRSNIVQYAPPSVKNREVSIKEKKNIKKITLRREGDVQCTELTPDGAVRTYSRCGSSIIDAKRVFNAANIYRLFDKISELVEGNYQRKGEGTVYEILVETGTGTEVYYITLEDGGSDTGGLTTIVTNVLGDVPTPTPYVAGEIPTITRTPSPTRTVTPGASPTPIQSGPTPTPSASAEQPFMCDFSENTQSKPTRISGVACTSQPN